MDSKIDLLKIHVHNPTQKFIEEMAQNELMPCISKPTRVTFNSTSLIDNIFCRGNILNNHKSYVLLEDVSDHYPCLVSITGYGDTSPPDLILYKRKMNDEAYVNLNQHLLFHDWSWLHPLNASAAYDYLIDVIKENLDDLAPAKAIIVNNKEFFWEPWMSARLCKFNSKRKRLFKHARDSGCPEQLSHYKLYRKTLCRLKLHEK